MMSKPPKVLTKEYAAFRADIVDYFVSEALPKTKTLFDPMAGTAPLVPYIEYYGLTAVFNDIQPFHAHINRAKCYAVYKALAAQLKKDRFSIQTELEHCLSSLKGKTLLISDTWLHNDILEGLLIAWKKSDEYNKSLKLFFRAVILLCARSFGSYTESYKNRTWHKPGGLSTAKDLSTVIRENIKRFSMYYEYYYKDKSDIAGGRICFYTKDATKRILKKKVDVILTSPAFPNRYDYIRTYGPELYFLSFVEKDLELNTLRRKITASNVVQDYRDFETDYASLKEMAPSTARFLIELKNKQRKSENDYYFRYFTKYYITLFRIVDGLLNTLSSRGSMYLVLQNNVHRGELNDLTGFVSEYCRMKGLRVEEVFRQLRTHQGRRNISADYPLVVKKHYEYIIKVHK